MVVDPIRDKNKIDALLMHLKDKSERDWLLAKFQLNTGLRISDVIKVRVQDLMTSYLSFKDDLVIQKKKIKLNNSLKKALNAYIEHNNLGQTFYIFQSRKGLNKPISVTQAYRILKATAVSLHIKNFGTHSLRKTWGYWTYKASRYNIGLIMYTFNHSSKKITLRYIGITQENKDELYSLVQF
ncbi:tyrosine-type recombinase/integrase [Clostridium sp. 001]|uniref:tyrosine-type recombinase/integrase n=1 Tax=Clostridium sp. 001 TaxID=1970093 RepID=UPI001C2BB7C4|nr:tyrosine-type recombinase/integrase [Clostridium sp. 001]QXE17985.1 recombinase XerD [Clostridium sp. 001]